MLLTLSFAADKFPRPVAAIAAIMSLAVPIAVIVEWTRGVLPVFVPIVDVLTFGWVLMNAIGALRRPESS